MSYQLTWHFYLITFASKNIHTTYHLNPYIYYCNVICIKCMCFCVWRLDLPFFRTSVNCVYSFNGIVNHFFVFNFNYLQFYYFVIPNGFFLQLGSHHRTSNSSLFLIKTLTRWIEYSRIQFMGSGLSIHIFL